MSLVSCHGLRCLRWLSDLGAVSHFSVAFLTCIVFLLTDLEHVIQQIAIGFMYALGTE